ELALAAHPHRADAFVPALDDASLADGKAQRLAAVVRRIELLAALEPAGVVHAHLVARTGRWSRPFHEDDVPESGGGLDDLFAHARELSLGYSPFRRGSRRSPSASPTRFKASTASMMASRANVVTQGP